jgi:ABC-type uncharacterized transport system substrate-binding protein
LKRRLAALLVLLLVAPCAAIAQVAARGYELRVLTGDDSAATRTIVQALKRRHPVTHASDAKALALRQGPALYVALGPSAVQAALSADVEAPVISLFTSSQAYVELTSRSRPKRARLTAIYAEAAPAHQMQLVSRLLGRTVRVGALISENTAHLVDPLRSAARDAGLELDVQRVRTGENPVRALSRLSSSTVLLAFPDSAIYTPASLRDILESTYRRNLPVIGFSSATVAAGSMGTAYSTVDDVLAQLDEVLNSTAAGSLPEPQFPRYWRVTINESVARSLNVIVTDEIRALGVRPPENQR